MRSRAARGGHLGDEPVALGGVNQIRDHTRGLPAVSTNGVQDKLP
jgi:hypothetical protein